MSIKSKFTVLRSALAVLVFSALAASVNLAVSQDSGPLDTLNTSANSIQNLVNTVTSIVVALAFLYFFYNLADYILSADSHDKGVAVARMGWSALAIFFIVSIWGIVGFIGDLVGIDTSATKPNDISLPTIVTGS